MSQYVPITLDKTRNLRYGIKALKIIEDTLDKPMAEMDLTKLKINDLTVFTYAGLVHEDKELTVEKVLDLIDEFSTIEELATAIGKAVEVAFGKKEKNL